MDQSDGRPPARSGGLSSLVTDEMRSAVKAAVRYELDSIEGRDYYGQVLPIEDTDVITDAVVAAIEPMLGKLIGDAQASEGELMREAGYKAGYRAGHKDGLKDRVRTPDQVLRDMGLKA